MECTKPFLESQLPKTRPLVVESVRNEDLTGMDPIEGMDVARFNPASSVLPYYPIVCLTYGM